MKTIKLLSIICLTAASATAADVTRLVPIFAEQVAGKNGSIWQSELRFYNPSQQSQVVRVERLLSGDGITCSGFTPLTMAPGTLAQIRSLGCPVGSATAVEISGSDSVEIASIITNLGGITQDPCCLAGFTQNIPVLSTIMAYTHSRTVANLQIPVVGLRDSGGIRNLGRHNLLFVNPNDAPLVVTLRYFSDSGISTDLFRNTSITLPPRSYGQLNDVLPQFEFPTDPRPFINGYWRIDASAALPFYFFDSYVDNGTNDATTIESN